MNNLLKNLALFLGFLSGACGYSQSLEWTWVTSSYGGLSPYIGNIFVDRDSSIYTCLSAHDDWNAGSYSIQLPRSEPTDADVIVWKLGRSGTTQWLNSYGTNWMDKAISIGRDENDKLFARCNINKFLSQNPIDTLSGGDFRFYIDEQGNWLNARKISPTITWSDARGRELFIGTLQIGDTVVFGKDTIWGPPIGTLPLYPEKYIAMVDSATGNYWGRYIGSYESQLPLHLRFLDGNKILLVGISQELTTMQCANSTIKGGIFWAFYDSLGNCQNYQTIDASQPAISRVFVNDQKEIHLLGNYSTTLSFDGRIWNNNNRTGNNFCLVKLDQDGTILWVNASEGSEHTNTVTSMVEDNSGNIILGGDIWGRCSIDNKIMGKDSVKDIFICAFSSIDGKLIWTKESDTQKPQAGIQQWGHLHALALNPENYLLVLGNFRTPTYILGRHELEFKGTQNLYIASLNLNFTKSLTPNLFPNCPLHLHAHSPTHSLTLKDDCPNQPIIHFHLYALSGQKITISNTEKLAQGYRLQPARSLPGGMYILEWERCSGAHGVMKFVLRE